MSETSEETIKSAAELAAERAEKLSEGSEEAATAQTGAESTSAEAGDAVAADAAKLQDELQAARDQSLRLVAEFDNFRRRSAREYQEAAASGRSGALTSLLPVFDNFERAFSAAGDDEEWIPADPANFAKGMRLILNQLRKALADQGLEEIQSLGQPFDPNLHDALTQMPHGEIPEGHIAQVFASGWKLGDKVVRHAQVIVSSGPAA